MKHLRKFNTQADYDAYTEQGIDYPCVSVVVDSGDTKYDGDDPFWVQPYEDCEYFWDVETEYSFNTVTWETLPEWETLLIPAYRKVYWRRAEAEHSGCLITDEYNIECTVGGNIMSLFHGADYRGNNTLPGPLCCEWLFSESWVADASRLVLPATTLTKGCYSAMFYLSTSLKYPPRLPATILADSCYAEMFYECEELLYTPKLPATRLSEACYMAMFFGCTKLESATTLPASKAKANCYNEMFAGCHNLSMKFDLPATTLAEGCYCAMFHQAGNIQVDTLPAAVLAEKCYKEMFTWSKITHAPTINATTLADECCYSMFAGCEELISAPALPVTKLASNCYAWMFMQCTKLTAAPELPATKLVNRCYDGMFMDCSSLNYVKAMFVDWLSYATSTWLGGVAETGIFVKNSAATWDKTGADGIPSGWTIEYAES